MTVKPKMYTVLGIPFGLLFSSSSFLLLLFSFFLLLSIPRVLVNEEWKATRANDLIFT